MLLRNVVPAGLRLGAGVALLAIVIGAGATSSPAGVAIAANDCVTDEIVDSEEQAFLNLVNAHRAQNGRAPLGLSHALSRSAAWKSKDMGVNRYFAHDDLSRTWVQRVRDCGYRYNTYIGENIAAGVSSAQAAFDLWKNSPGHNANMLSTNFTTIGIGREYVAGSPYGWYWTTNFGGVDDGYAVIAEPRPIDAIPSPTPAIPEASPTGQQPDTSPPLVTLSSQLRGRQMRLTARASDDTGVVRVEFRVDGRSVKVDKRAPYAATIRRPGRGDVIEAAAYDAAGNVTITRAR
jgi:uncharacterized protein YkwD